MSARILIVDDERNLRRVLAAHLKREGWEVGEAVDGAEALERLAQGAWSLVITDLKMPNLDGLGLLEQTAARHPDLPVVLITAHGTIETAVTAMKRGAFDYITKPFDQEELLAVVRKALATGERQGRELRRPGPIGTASEIIGASPAIQAMLKMIDRVADSPSSVLIQGETGTGKELIARALHQKSQRASKPFIAVNCGAIPENLMESEFFGYEKGAFTGAASSKPGRFELADGGTLFLDEIGELPKPMQVKLLRVLQEQTLERVGGVKTIRVDVRLLSATHQDLKLKIKEGSFREDLYYRLNTVTLKLPALRERKEDLPLLTDHLLRKYSERLRRPLRGMSPEAQAALSIYDYPGNIRELENVIERGVLLSQGPLLRLEDLPEELHCTPSLTATEESSSPDRIKERMKSIKGQMEREMIVAALHETGGNVTLAAKQLGLSRKGLQLKMKAYQIRREE
ncbi:MAG: sigma-54 dependent transcriptional regulator [Candidatus Manganitrophus sp. SB1]|nr:sigma-54 dependent transcriptional regulator [Candidatus Manganitrophus morganii]